MIPSFCWRLAIALSAKIRLRCRKRTNACLRDREPAFSEIAFPAIRATGIERQIPLEFTRPALADTRSQRAGRAGHGTCPETACRLVRLSPLDDL